jgi:uncharacterized protein (TIGR00251 family)
MRLNIRVQPNSGRQEIQKSIDGSISKVFLKKPAENGKANAELEKFLSRHFGRRVKIIKGYTSRTKMVEVEESQ